MKKLLVTLIVLSLAAMTAFFMLFDLERFKPRIEREISQALGHPVAIGPMSLVWSSGGIRVTMDDFTVRDARTREPLIGVDRAEAVLRFIPLLSKKIELKSLNFVRPSVTVIRDPDGGISIRGMKTAPEREPQAAQEGAARAEPSKLAIDRLEIENGRVLFVNRDAARPAEISIEKIDATLRNFSPGQPLDADVKAAFFSDRQNVVLSAQLVPTSPERAQRVEAASLSADLAAVDARRLQKSLPWLRLDPSYRLRGELEATIKDLEPADRDLKRLVASIKLTDASFQLPGSAESVTAAVLQADWREGVLTVNRADGRLAGGTFAAAGEARGLPRRANSHWKVEMNGIEAGRLLKSRPGAPRLEGKASASAEWSMRGLTKQEILPSLDGALSLRGERMVIADYNLLAKVLGHVLNIPSVGEAFAASLPPRYHALLASPRTEIRPFDVRARIAEGAVIIPDLRAEADGFMLDGAGRVAFSGALSGLVTIVVEPDLSAALVAGVSQLSYLQTAGGTIDIPVTLGGTIRKPRIFPDVAGLAAQAAVSKGADLLGGALERALQGAQPEPAAAPAAPIDPLVKP